MVTRKSIGVVLVVSASVSALALAYLASQCARDAGTGPVSKRLHVNVDVGREKLPAGVHAKIKPPADILVEVTDAGEVGGPVAIAVHAASLVPVRSAKISIKIPQVGAEFERTESLWSTASVGFVAQTIEYTTAPLPAGTYRFTAILEFGPEREGAETLMVAESLYLDVRPDTVLSSTVSFDHIKRIELLHELESQDQSVTKGGVVQIKTTDANVARRISELNRIKDETAASADGTERSVVALSETEDKPAALLPPRGGPPASEIAVPVRPRDAQ